MLEIIISILVTAFLSLLIAKWQIKKNQISHFYINSYDIGKGLTEDFPDFALHYGDEVLSKNVKVLEGGFMNTGRNDIDALNGVSDIKLLLPENCIFKAIQVSSSDNNLNINPTIDNEKKNMVGFGIKELFMSFEHFEYTAIVEVPENMLNLEDELSFEHRIKNTEKKIENIHIGQVKKTPVIKMIRVILCSLLFLFLAFCSFLMVFQPLGYKALQNGTNNRIRVWITPKSNMYVSENKLFSLPVKKITIEELNNSYSITPITTYRWSLLIYFIASCLLLFVYFLIFFNKFFGGRKANKISRVLYEAMRKKELIQKQLDSTQ